jgi:hypothetical protein
MKASKLRRKEFNRAMAALPFPRAPRQFAIAPTFAGTTTDITCPRLVKVQWKRRRLFGWVRKPLGKPVACGTPLELVPYRRKLRCPACAREAKRLRHERLTLNPPAYGKQAVTNMLTAVSIGMARMFKRRSAA